MWKCAKWVWRAIKFAWDRIADISLLQTILPAWATKQLALVFSAVMAGGVAVVGALEGLPVAAIVALAVAVFLAALIAGVLLVWLCDRLRPGLIPSPATVAGGGRGSPIHPGAVPPDYSALPPYHEDKGLKALVDAMWREGQAGNKRGEEALGEQYNARRRGLTEDSMRALMTLRIEEPTPERPSSQIPNLVTSFDACKTQLMRTRAQLSWLLTGEDMAKVDAAVERARGDALNCTITDRERGAWQSAEEKQAWALHNVEVSALIAAVRRKVGG